MKKILVFIFLMTSFLGWSQNKLSAKDQKLVYDFDLLNSKDFKKISLEDENGNIVNTDSLKGKTIYVDCWFTSCPPCLTEIPFAKSLQSFFATDTSILFLNICIDNIEKKELWKRMIKEKQLGGIHVFYARNRPQNINLLREYRIDDFPTYFLLNKEMKIIGHHVPRPSNTGWVHWAIKAASTNIKWSDAYLQGIKQEKSFKQFMIDNASKMPSAPPKK